MRAQIRHTAFLERLAAATDGSDEWRWLALLFRILGQLDGWTRATPSDQSSVEIESTLIEMEVLAQQHPMRRHLTTIASLIDGTEPNRASRATAAEALFELSAWLRDQGFFDLAIDVASTGLEHANSESEIQWRLHAGCAWVCRILGELDRAQSHDEQCLDVGEHLGAAEAVFEDTSACRKPQCFGAIFRLPKRRPSDLLDWAVRLRRQEFVSRRVTLWPSSLAFVEDTLRHCVTSNARSLLESSNTGIGS